MEVELEGGDYAQAAAAAAGRPPQLGVLGAAGGADHAVGGDELEQAEVVAAQAVGAHQQSHAAPKGKPGDAGGRHLPARGGQAEQLGLAVQLPQVTPAWARTVRAFASTCTPFMADRSMTSPSSQTAVVAISLTSVLRRHGADGAISLHPGTCTVLTRGWHGRMTWDGGDHLPDGERAESHVAVRVELLGPLRLVVDATPIPPLRRRRDRQCRRPARPG